MAIWGYKSISIPSWVYNAPAHMHSRRFSVFQFSQGRVATLSKVGLYRR